VDIIRGGFGCQQLFFSADFFFRGLTLTVPEPASPLLAEVFPPDLRGRPVAFLFVCHDSVYPSIWLIKI
jgi:hypothetical protein